MQRKNSRHLTVTAENVYFRSFHAVAAAAGAEPPPGAAAIGTTLFRGNAHDINDWAFAAALAVVAGDSSVTLTQGAGLCTHGWAIRAGAAGAAGGSGGIGYRSFNIILFSNQFN